MLVLGRIKKFDFIAIPIKKPGAGSGRAQFLSFNLTNAPICAVASSASVCKITEVSDDRPPTIGHLAAISWTAAQSHCRQAIGDIVPRRHRLRCGALNAALVSQLSLAGSGAGGAPSGAITPRHVLLVGIIGTLAGIFGVEPIAEQINWFTVMRPYRVANFDPYVLKPDTERALRPLASFRECAKDCPEMIVIPAGGFTMGSPADEAVRFGNEGLQHQVTIAKPFAVSKFDVTFADWDACVSARGCPHVADSGLGRNKKPVINITWYDARQYAAWLSRMTGQPYRLPTEAEWEYAARAGTTTAYYWGDEIGKGNANCKGCGNQWDRKLTAAVGSFPANAFGLYDMAGNVWQWVQDCYHEDYSEAPADGSAWSSGDCSRRVLRGGSWDYNPRSALRLRGTASFQYSLLSFRVARTLTP
jgi:formylglycine-generating enzyme required for sulfatase activity